MAPKTYLLAPDFTFAPDGPIRIGTIIADPFRPLKPLFTPQTEPETTKHTELANVFTREKHRSAHGGIWAQFLHTAKIDLSGGTSCKALLQYNMESLETIKLKKYPTDAEATKLVTDIQEVRDVMEISSPGNARVFMITGVKVAKGFQYSSQNVTTAEAGVVAAVPLTENVGAGGDLSVARGSVVGDSARSASDIVFAYQLHVIKRGWWSWNVSANVYEPDSAFLNKDDGDGKEAEEITAEVASEKHLKCVRDENEEKSVVTLQVDDNGEMCVCFAFPDI